MVVTSLNNHNFHDRRFSDHPLFWGFVIVILLLAHYYLFTQISLFWAGSYITAVWFVLGTSAVVSSFTAARLGSLRPIMGNTTLQAVFNRFGSTWNIFIFQTSLLLLLIQTIGRIFSPLAPEHAFSAAALASFAICLYGLIEARSIVTLKLAMHTRALPPGRERLRIVQLSDLHIGPFMHVSHIARVIRETFNAMPDLVVITGDVVDGNVGDGRATLPFYRPFSRVIAQLKAFSIEFGVWGVPGNHDYFEGFEGSRLFFKDAGINLLQTEKTDLGDIVLVGADDRDHLTPSDGNPRITRSEALLASLSEEEERKFVLLLRHRPAVEDSTVGRFNLQLSGHTHGGQLFTLPSSRHRLPGKSRGFVSLGHGKSAKESWLYVSNGAGFVGPPMRFFSPAEIVVIDILRQHDE